MFVLGVGIGGVMQVLVIAVQNVVPYRDLGVATSGATFFRSIGGSFGTAVFGAIFASQLSGNLAHYLAGTNVPAGFNAKAGASPAVLATLPPAVHSGFIHAYADSLHTVFLAAVPVAAVAFLLAWWLKEVPLRETTAAPDQAQALAPTAMPANDDPADEVVRILSVLARRGDRARIYTELAATADVDLDPRSTWLLYRLDGRPRMDITDLADTLQLSVNTLHALLSPLTRQGYVTLAGPTEIAATTPQGHAAIERLVAARRARLEARLGSWADEQDARLTRKLDELARDLLDDLNHQHALTGPAPSKDNS